MPHFSNKGNFSNKIIISEKDCIASDDTKLSEIFITHFIDITKTLHLKPSIISATKSWNWNPQKQPPEVFREKMCSSKFRKIYRKAPVNFAKF